MILDTASVSLGSYYYENKNYTNEGNFLNVLRKENNEWKMIRIIFNDLDPIVKQL